MRTLRIEGLGGIEEMQCEIFLTPCKYKQMNEYEQIMEKEGDENQFINQPSKMGHLFQRTFFDDETT